VFASEYTECVVSSVFESYSDFLTFSEKTRESGNTGMMDIDIFLTCECSENHKSSRFYIVMNDRKFSNRIYLFYTDYIDGMIVINSNIRSLFSEKIDEICYVWFNGGEVDLSVTGTQNIGSYEVFCSGNSKAYREVFIPFLEFPRKMDTFIAVHGTVPDFAKSVQMLINRTFSDITTTWKRNIYRTKTIEKRREKQNRSTDFLHKFAIHSGEGYLGHIHNEGIFREIHRYAETLNNFQKRENISNPRNIMKCYFFEQEACSDERKCRIFGTAYFDSSGKTLISGYFKHRFL